MNKNEESVLMIRRMMLNNENNVTDRSNSFASQQNVFEHC
jgi:hypothetical protein